MLRSITDLRAGARFITSGIGLSKMGLRHKGLSLPESGLRPPSKSSEGFGKQKTYLKEQGWRPYKLYYKNKVVNQLVIREYTSN